MIKNLFIKKKILFFKYTKEDLNNSISTINLKINSSRNKEKKELISINFNEKILDREFEKNKNDTLNKEIKVDKYLNIIGKTKKNNNDEINNIDPLNPSNFQNDFQNKDIYEKLNLDYDYQMNIPYDLKEPKLMNSKQSQKNNMDVNLIPF